MLREYKFVITILFLTALLSCAKIGRPTGGEKDVTAPILVSASPNQNSTNFDAKKIKIFFDEYIKLKDVNRQLVISPPLKYNLDITPLGTASKTITLKIKDTLKENTTYTFNFGKSVVDNNEENELERFKYVFSTGDYIDSLKLSGTVYDAFKRTTDEDISVMLYEMNGSFTDSLIYKEKPLYITSTLDSTYFELTNLKAGKYVMVAIKQPSNNYIYNQKQDKLGFVSSIITLPTDSVYQIPVFKEIVPFKLLKPVETSKGHIFFGFEGDGQDLSVKLLNNNTYDFNEVAVFEQDKDTLSYWYQNVELDSLIFEVKNFDFSDILTVKLRSSKKDSLIISNKIRSALEIRDTFSITTNIPITKIDTSKISLINRDSLNIPFQVILNAYKNRMLVNFEKEFLQEYSLQMLPETIADIFGNTNDTLSYKLRTKLQENYGTINLNVPNVKRSVIIQLINEKDKLIETVFIDQPQTIKFKNLLPDTYIVRAILDENENGKWDTGNYFQKKYPEKVIYFETPLELRANWDLNESFILNWDLIR